VINARIRFIKQTGGAIEIFCLEPHETNNEYSSIMNRKAEVSWKCFVGGAAKWKEPALIKKIQLQGEEVMLTATLSERIQDAYIIHFSWTPATYTFAEIVESAGDIPLPPYIKRNTDIEDKSRYQTIYALEQGSVAAPTAGLHFTESIFEQLALKNIHKEYVTLHVGAGTFKPVKADKLQEHEMHAEWIDVTISSIQNLISTEGNIVAVGTTSARTLESLYWLGVKALMDPDMKSAELHQWDVYESPLTESNFSKAEALTALVNWMQANQLKRLFTQTQLLITPGYQFRIINALITNFHQPQSTLLLLVAAATGGYWNKMYDYALENDFRFLSYGDGNLVFIS
jgi:S-adenosylmethionine:tRNA ribosyltransferase-isomerase